MDAFVSMSEKLGKTGLYHIAEGTLIYDELMAYAEGLAVLYRELETMLRECFVSTAQDYGLDIMEQTVCRCHIDHTMSGRKKAVLAALSVSNQNNTMAYLEKYQEIFNVHGVFTESNDEGVIRFTCSDTLTDSQRIAIAEQMAVYMPCWEDFELV